VAEVIPALFDTPGMRRMVRGAAKELNREGDLRRRLAALEVSDTIENRRLLAQEYIKLGRYKDALDLYDTTLVGMHADDPSLLLGLARAADGVGDHARAIEALDHLRETNPDLDSAEGHLIYAKSLEALGREDEAMAEYDALVQYAPGEEARCRRALLLRKRGQMDEARRGFEEILERAKHAPGRYRRNEREWIETARRFAAA
jgi:hypothetical protein